MCRHGNLPLLRAVGIPIWSLLWRRHNPARCSCVLPYLDHILFPRLRGSSTSVLSFLASDVWSSWAEPRPGLLCWLRLTSYYTLPCSAEVCLILETTDSFYLLIYVHTTHKDYVFNSYFLYNYLLSNHMYFFLSLICLSHLFVAWFVKKPCNSLSSLIVVSQWILGWKCICY